MTTSIRRALTIAAIMLLASVVASYTVIIANQQSAKGAPKASTLDSLRVARLERGLEQVARIFGDSVLTNEIAIRIIAREVRDRAERELTKKQLLQLRRDQNKLMQWVLEKPNQPRRQELIDSLAGKRDSTRP